MTAVPGTYFTKEQLRAELYVDDVPLKHVAYSVLNNDVGFIYRSEKKQYDKALAWYILAVMQNDSKSQLNIGNLYNAGLGVPKNYLCALKWYLKSVRRSGTLHVHNNIGELFENGRGVPLEKYKTLEWYCHGKMTTDPDRLKAEGYHRSARNKNKSLKFLIMETEAILNTEREKLEEKHDKTHEEMETLEQLKVTYKMTDGGMHAWRNLPILLASAKQDDVNPANGSIVNHQDEIHELKKQIQLLKQELSTFEVKPNNLSH